MPIFAALGADVTSFDNSSVQLAKDKKVANENNLSINVIEGDMQIGYSCKFGILMKKK